MKSNSFKAMFQDKAFLKRTVTIAVPIMLQSLLNNVLNFVDTLMIGQLGETTIAAVGLANKVFFVVSLIIFGCCSGAGILSAQYWGVRDVKNIHRVLGMTLILAVGAGALFMGASVAAPELVMSVFTNSESAIAIGASYLVIVAISYPITAISQVYMSTLRSINDVKSPVIIGIIAIIVNVILNYILIFGKFGFPELGVIGAAIATLISRIIECLVVLGIVYIKKSPIAASISSMLAFTKDFVSKFFKTVIFVILNEMMWSVGVTMYSLVYGRMGDDATAAITVTQSIEQILQVLFMGLANASAIILGNALGAGKLDQAKLYAKYLFRLQFLASIAIALLCFVLQTPIVSLFDVKESVKDDIYSCFYVFIAFLYFRGFNFINVVGVLRSGGDTKVCLILDVSGVWLIGVPLAYLGGIVLELPIYWVYAMVSVEELYKLIVGSIRYKQKKWCRNLIEKGH